jgi:hypothetical protein
MSTMYEGPNFAVFSNLLPFHPTGVHIYILMKY